MQSLIKVHQRGITFFGLLFVAIVLALTGVVVAQVVPTVVEYYAIGKAAQKASTGQTIVEVRDIFSKAAQIDDIRSMTADGLDIVKENDKVVVSYAYTREIHLFGPAYLTLKYQGQSK